MVDTQRIITLIPLNGLANRMRAIVAVKSLADDLNCEMEVAWKADDTLNCRFDELFELKPLPFEIIEISGLQKLKYALPRKQNLGLPALVHRMFFDKALYDGCNIEQYCRSLPKLRGVMERSPHLLLATGSGRYFYPTRKSYYKSLFEPTAEIKRRIEDNCSRFGLHTFGFHVRRGDNRQSIERSPLTSFVSVMERCADECADAQFYVATDDETVKRQLRDRFGDRLLLNEPMASRTTPEGMKQAVAELYSLGNTCEFYGSYYSSFSYMVPLVSAVPSHIIGLDGADDSENEEPELER